MLIRIKQKLNQVLDLPRPLKILIAISLDFFACILSVWLAYFLRLGDFANLSVRGSESLVLALIISYPIFSFFGLYRSIVRYSGIFTLLLVSKAIITYGILYSLIISFISIQGIPRTIGIIQPILMMILIISWRLILQWILKPKISQDSGKKDCVNALVYGSGEAGRQLVSAMENSNDILIRGFIDDDIKKQGMIIYGKRIYSPKELKKILIKRKINLILLALPSVSRKRRNEIVSQVSKFKIAVRSIPGIEALARGKSQITDFSDLDFDDLLGREAVTPFQSLMRKNIYNRNVLVTGSGGSIGSELCRQIIKQKPKKLILFEISEIALYNIHSELDLLKDYGIQLIPLIGSIRDLKRVEEIISIWRPSTIYHAAAYKHVPIVEYNLIEGFKNNVIATYNLAEISLKYNVSNFVFISTDKAVRPTNIMGATKRLAELCLQALNQKTKESNINESNTTISIVRFGNVIDSSGSVIPKFRNQIRKGGPITLTHKKITRYFMTITEAAQLVIQAGAMAEGGDVFVLDMGEPIKIYDLAVKMIELSGFSLRSSLNSKGNIEIQITGLRPGEKLYEELLLSKNPIKTKHPKICKSNEPFIKYALLKDEMNSIQKLVLENDHKNLLNKLKKLVIDYSPTNEIIDYTYKNKI